MHFGNFARAFSGVRLGSRRLHGALRHAANGRPARSDVHADRRAPCPHRVHGGNGALVQIFSGIPLEHMVMDSAGRNLERARVAGSLPVV